MGMGMGTPAVDHGPDMRHVYEHDDDPRSQLALNPRGGYNGADGRGYDHDTYEEAPDSVRRTAPLAIKKASKEAERDRVTSPASGLAPGARGDEGLYRVDMNRSGSSRSGEGDSLR
jgi:hypothetical protein